MLVSLQYSKPESRSVSWIAVRIRPGYAWDDLLRGIKDWVNEDAYNGSIWKFDLVLRKWELFRIVTLSLSEWFGWELPSATWYVGIRQVGTTENYTLGWTVTIREHCEAQKLNHSVHRRKWLLCCTTCTSLTGMTTQLPSPQPPDVGSFL